MENLSNTSTKSDAIGAIGNQSVCDPTELPVWKADDIASQLTTGPEGFLWLARSHYHIL